MDNNLPNNYNDLLKEYLNLKKRFDKLAQDYEFLKKEYLQGTKMAEINKSRK